uniref:Uncharacterized protein n=1 Tax=Callorhinchus milii TaxID=7868 RepID=A0A4W3HFH7_CALMI
MVVSVVFTFIPFMAPCFSSPGCVINSNTHCVYSDPCYVLLSVIVRLRDIDLTTDSTEDVSSDLKINHKLTDLNLSHNKLGDRGVNSCPGPVNPSTHCGFVILYYCQPSV